MSNDDKKIDTKPAWYMTGPGGARPIPVRQLRVPAGSDFVIELPGGAVGAAQKTVSDDGRTRSASGEWIEAAPNKPRNKIFFLPWLGCFAIECYRPSDDGLQLIGPVTMVPREWAHWTPME